MYNKMKMIKKAVKAMWLGIKIANENYLNGKCHHGKF